MSADGFHEDFSRHAEEEKSSERSFGLVFAAFCALVGVVKWHHGAPSAVTWLGVAALFLAFAYLWTTPLRPLNMLWSKLGQVLFAITNPIIMAIMFFIAVMPTGLALRLLQKDLLRLRTDASTPTYWLKREPPGPDPQTMTNQF
jgi:hypothetical protein